MESDPPCSHHRQGVRDIRFFLPLFLLLIACGDKPTGPPKPREIAVKDDTGKPVISAAVWFLNPETWEKPDFFEHRFRTSHETGRIFDFDLPPGRYWAAVNSPDHARRDYTGVDTSFATESHEIVLRPVVLVSRDRNAYGTLGDVNRDGYVDVYDVIIMYVRLIEGGASYRLANNNGDSYWGNWDDFRLLATYVYGDDETRSYLTAEYGIDEDFSHPKEFNIEIIWTSDLTDHQKEIILRAASRWEEIIWRDVPEFRGYTFIPYRSKPTSWWVNEFSTKPQFEFNGVVDDVVVFIGRTTAAEQDQYYAQGGPLRLRETETSTHLGGREHQLGCAAG